MKIIRKNSFETNSSSTHSLTLENKLISWDTSWGLTFEREYVIPRKEYGWEFKKYNLLDDKVPYIAMLVHLDPIKRVWLEEILMEETKASKVVWSLLSCHPDNFIDSYIDHSGEGKGIKEVLQSKESMRNFLFNKFCWLVLGNDNQPQHPNWGEPPYIYKAKKYYISPVNQNDYIVRDKELFHNDYIFRDEESFYFDGPLKGPEFHQILANYIGYLMNRRDIVEDIYKEYSPKNPEIESYNIEYTYQLPENSEQMIDRYHQIVKKFYRIRKQRRRGQTFHIVSIPIIWFYSRYSHRDKRYNKTFLKNETFELMIKINEHHNDDPEHLNFLLK